jgi:hypothetical protein
MSQHVRTYTATVLLALLALACQFSLLAARGTAPVVSGDEGTFLAMTSSLALDGDLDFSSRDRERLESYTEAGRRAVILQKTESGISYSKPTLFPLLAAPWYRLFGETGVVLLNAVALSLALICAWGFLRRRTGVENPAPEMVSFVGTGVLLSYVVWTMSDSLQASLVLAGLAMALGGSRMSTAGGRLDRFFSSPSSAVLGSVLLGMAASMRFPNLLLALAPPIALVLQGRRRRGALAAVVLALTVLGALGVNQVLAGAPVPYKALRATFNAQTGYPAGEGGGERLAHFEEARATHRLGVLPTLKPRVSLYSSLYFFVGRHTGLLLYASAALVFAWAAVRRRDTVGWTLVAAAAAMAIFYIFWMPRNYFGGGTFLGNRYFLTAQAALLLAPRCLPGRRALTAVWGIAIVVFVSALYSSARTRESDGTSQMHAHAGVFRLFPYESTATDLDGRRDRYWSDELVRFVDPFAGVGEHGFKLTAGAPAAEIVTASGRGHGVIRLLVQANVPEVELVYRDWLTKKRYRFRAEEGGARGFLEVTPSPTIRRHPYWWDEQTLLSVRALSLQLLNPAGGPAQAEVRYAGPYRFVPRFYRAELESVSIPSRGAPGASRRLSIGLRNTGSRYWATDDPIPVFLGYRLYELPRLDGTPTIYGPLTPLSERVSPGDVLNASLDFQLPGQEGQYEVVIDLVVAGLNWFEEWNAKPLATGRIRVREPDEYRP